MVDRNVAMDPRQQALNSMWQYLINQGIMGGFQFPTYDSAYLQDVQKMYEDTILGDPMMFYDTVLPKYQARVDAGDPRAIQMIGYFDLIEREGYSPDTFLKDTTIGSQLNENEKADLATYASEKDARDKAAYKFNQDMAAKAALYELPDPYATYNLPLNIVQDLIRQKDGKTPQEAAVREMMVMRARAPKPPDTVTVMENQPVGYADNPLKAAQGTVVDALNWFDRNIAKPVRGALKNLAPGIAGDIPVVEAAISKIGTGVPQSAKYTKEVPVTRKMTSAEKKAAASGPLAGGAGAMAGALGRLAESQAQRELDLQKALIEEIMTRYGTPFDIAAKEAARIAASRKRGASGNWPS